VPIIIRPTVTKGIAANVVLNKSMLAVHPTVVLDPKFSIISKWKKVVMFFVSTDGKQNVTIEFNCSGLTNTPSTQFKVSLRAKGSKFNISSVKIFDYDGGHLDLSASQLDLPDYEMNLLGIQAPNSLTAEAFQHPDGSWYVDLTFSSVLGALSYKVFRGTVAGVYEEISSEIFDYDGDYITIGSDNIYFDEFSDDDGSMLEGEEYFYVVQAYNGDTSLSSPEASVVIGL
jgi:hypothetical protein